MFGIPGDYILAFYNKLVHSPLQVINTCDEQGAGFAADAYARLNGIGVVCVTYNAGGLKVVNTTAQAYAEELPVIVISGAPGLQERNRQPLLHHKAKEYTDQIRIFEHITAASTNLNNPQQAQSEINRVLLQVQAKKRPGFIELPRDIVDFIPTRQSAQTILTPPKTSKANQAMLRQAADIAKKVLNEAHQPVIIAGIEVARYELENAVMELAQKANIPIASTILGKSAVDETNPLFMGVYAGIVGNDSVRQYVESSDCIILIGVLLMDINLGANTAKLQPQKLITISNEKTAINNQVFPGIGLKLLNNLNSMNLNTHEHSQMPLPQKQRKQNFSPKPPKITIQRLVSAIDSFLDEDTVVIADVGDSICACLDLTIPKPRHFLAPAYYSSLGFSVPASIGVQARDPHLRPLVIVGDGAFQMTGMELSTAIRYHMNPIVVVLNNSGFGTERPMIDGPFNNVSNWRYHRLPNVLNAGRGFLISDENELVDALKKAKEYEGASILEVVLDPTDISPQLQRICQHLLGKTRKDKEESKEVVDGLV